MAQEVIAPTATLPAMRRLDRTPERLLYETRAGLGALPSGIGVMALTIAPQILALGFLFWAIWWPEPVTRTSRIFAWGCSALLVALVLGVAGLLMRRYRGFVTAVLRAPFTRIRVTDQRVQWLLPWTPTPLMEIGRHRILGGLLGPVDAKGRGNAAMVLVDGDPAADIDGNIHFDRLPHAERFVAALSG
ncbi:hypothetical protein PQ455_11915 [Sphingomonas naphthae]|uniref:PH domain-containing protein n=1 Tax=Sphingomonas naphthae TaxID=1813468 RepID=A0ABY7TH04_9SPHN|nr:hypothetical protein [Sphingomonas naphthae]WCT72343.1 hypothetical protein PQ455_11915 [Sphingomonas naphthae]